MGQKFEGNCGVWVPNEILKKSYPENLKKRRKIKKKNMGKKFCF